MSSIDSLEEAELNYKALLVNVTKKRKEYPKKLAKYLAYTVRLETNAIEAMNVDLPPQKLLETGPTLPDEVAKESYEETENILNELVKDIQLQTSQMVNLKDALEIMNNNKTDPWPLPNLYKERCC